MFDFIFNNILLDSFNSFSAFFMVLYMAIHFSLKLMNSVTGIPAASSLNFPITFLLVESKYGEFSE